MISIIIPTYNEQLVIRECIESLLSQKGVDFEIIVIDDGSTDDTVSIVRSLESKKVEVYEKDHLGPGNARNYGVSKSKGNIIVFADSDMTFDKSYVLSLTLPIEKGKTRGTFTKEEYVSNWKNVWARCWNYNQGIKSNKRIPDNYGNKAPVFRAILKKEFEKVGGFTPIGYTDDWTLSRKLGYQADIAEGAICYHKNPEKLIEVFRQSSWIGKNEFFTKGIKKYFNLFRYSILVSLIVGLIKTIIYKEFRFIFFKIVYDLGVWISIIKSFFNNELYK